MNRQVLREEAFKLIFETEVQKGSASEILDFYFEDKKMSDKEKSYILDVVLGVFENLNEIDNTISKYAKGWKIERLSKISLAVLRLAVFEMTKRDDIPISVSINEAIELAKKYEEEKAAAFVNGILGSIDKDILSRWFLL